MFKLKDLFDIKYGHSYELCYQEEDEEGIAFVSRTSKNNGVSSRIRRTKDEPAPAGAITVACGGSVLSTFIQPEPFYTGRDILYMLPKQDMCIRQKFWYVACIKENKFKYNYGRQANKTLPDIEVPEPPDWVYELEIPDYTKFKKPVIEEPVPNFQSFNWHPFLLTDLFYIKKGKSPGNTTWAENNPGKTPYLTATTQNNSISCYVDCQPEFNSCISVTTDGKPCIAFYQPRPFVIGSNCLALEHKDFKLSTLQSLFICTMIRNESWRFNYGRKLNLERANRLQILLPATEDNKPDYDLIEYILLRTPYSKSLVAQAIEQKEVLVAA